MITTLVDVMRFLVRLRLAGVVVLLVLVTLLAVAVGAVVAKVCRALRRRRDATSID